MNNKLILTFWFLALLFLTNSQRVQAQTQTFTYQGSLKSGASPANGIFDFQIDIYGSEFGGTPFATNTLNLVDVRNGVFTVTLSAATGAFNGEARFLEIRVKPAGAESYELLTPRQLITSAPYAVRSLNAQTAVNATNAVSAQTAETAVAAVSATFAANVTGTVALANGGTGANSSAGARTNLGLGTLSTVTPTGTADDTKFLRGDNTWADAPMHFYVKLTSREQLNGRYVYYPNGVASGFTLASGDLTETYLWLPRACKLGDFKVKTFYLTGGESRVFNIRYRTSFSTPSAIALSVTVDQQGNGSTTNAFNLPAGAFIYLEEIVSGTFANPLAWASFNCR